MAYAYFVSDHLATYWQVAGESAALPLPVSTQLIRSTFIKLN